MEEGTGGGSTQTKPNHSFEVHVLALVVVGLREEEDEEGKAGADVIV